MVVADRPCSPCGASLTPRSRTTNRRHFWSTKMGLAGASADALAASKSALDAFLSDAAKLAAVRRVLAEGQGLTDQQRHVLAILEKTFKVGRRAGRRSWTAVCCGWARLPCRVALLHDAGRVLAALRWHE